MKKHLLGLFVAVIIFTSMSFVYYRYPYFMGAIEAQLDVLRGKYLIKTYGRLAAERDEYNVVFNVYGFEVVPVADCQVTEDVRERTRGYNSVSVTAIDKAFGKRPWERLQQRLGPVNPEREREKDREFAKRCRLQNR
jgi:hypothetical protein